MKLVLTLVSYFTCDCFAHYYIRRLVPYFPLKFFKLLFFSMVIRRLPNCIWLRRTREYLIHIFIELLHWFEVAVRHWKLGSWSLLFGRQTLKRRCGHRRNIYITHCCSGCLVQALLDILLSKYSHGFLWNTFTDGLVWVSFLYHHSTGTVQRQQQIIQWRSFFYILLHVKIKVVMLLVRWRFKHICSFSTFLSTLTVSFLKIVLFILKSRWRKSQPSCYNSCPSPCYEFLIY